MLEAPQSSSSWYLDSGATHHVSGDPNVFSSISPTSGSQIKSAGGQSHDVTGVGNVDIQGLSGEIKTISFVLYTPGITKNLLSVGSLTNQQKTLVFNSTCCFVIDKITSRIEAFAHRENGKGLYRLQTDFFNQRPEVNTLQVRSQPVLWHKRLGHFHTRGMQRMIASEAVKGLPQFQIPKQTCNGCQLGKHARTKIQKEATFNASRKLELIHSDVCGPFRICCTGGAKYFVTFTDDFSRKIWIYFITQKSQVLEKFQHFVRTVENVTGQTVCTLRTDNGGEYTSKAFSNFCSLKGITHKLTPPYTPQRNGVAERRNRSLLDITRCLLLDKALPGHLWGEAVKAAGDILNLRSTKRHPDKTPNELFFGKKPSIAHLRIFGSPVFAHISKRSRTKLEPRSEKCILLSFDENAKAYRCFRPSTKKIFVSRDVFIDEDNLFDFPPTLDSPPSPPDDFISAPTHTDNFPLPTHTETGHHSPDTQASPTSPAHDSDNLPTSTFPTHNINSTQSDSGAAVPSTSTTTTESSSSDTEHLRETSPPQPTPAIASNPLRRSDRIRHFPRHLQDLMLTLNLISLTLHQSFNPSSPSNRCTLILSGRPLCKHKWTPFAATTHGRWLHSLPIREPYPQDGSSKSKPATMVILLATKRDWWHAALNKRTVQISSTPSPRLSGGRRYGFSSPSPHTLTGQFTSSTS